MCKRLTLVVLIFFFFAENTIIYLHSLSFLQNELLLAEEILPYGRQGPRPILCTQYHNHTRNQVISIDGIDLIPPKCSSPSTRRAKIWIRCHRYKLQVMIFFNSHLSSQCPACPHHTLPLVHHTATHTYFSVLPSDGLTFLCCCTTYTRQLWRYGKHHTNNFPHHNSYSL